MDLRARLKQDVVAAMKAREAGRERLAVLRLVLAGIQTAEIEAHRPLGDDEVIAVLRREIRQRQDTIAQIEGRGRDEQSQALAAEIDILRGYLPAAMDSAEIRSLAAEVIAELRATSPKEMGKVMAALMPRVAGRAEGQAVSAAVRQLLQG